MPAGRSEQLTPAHQVKASARNAGAFTFFAARAARAIAAEDLPDHFQDSVFSGFCSWRWPLVQLDAPVASPTAEFLPWAPVASPTVEFLPWGRVTPDPFATRSRAAGAFPHSLR